MKEVASKHEKTKHKQIDLFVLPELCPLGYSDHSFNKFLPLDEDAIKMMEEVDELFSAFAKVRY